MSDYVHNKAVFYPITKEQYEDIFDVETSPFTNIESAENFDSEIMVEYNSYNVNYYLIYQLYSDYGAECSDFGRNRVLTETEQEKYKKLFEQIISDIDPTKFKYVDYCYYNCSEPPDYYLGSDLDDFYKEI